MTPPTLTLDGNVVTVAEYSERVERSTARVYQAAYHRPVARTPEPGILVDAHSVVDWVEEDPGVAAAALVTTLAAVVAAGGATWGWVFTTLGAQRDAQLGALPTHDANPGSRRTDDEHLPEAKR